MAASVADVPAGMVFTSGHKNLNLIEDLWIVDFGATSHITHFPHSFFSHLFVESRPSVNHFVTLPKQTKIGAISIGNIMLSSSLVLHNVLYIPQFHINLLLILALLHSSNYSLFFFNHSFIIQDLASKKEIGRGDQLGGLYVLQPVPFPSSLPSLVSFVIADTWHARFGHLSNNVLNSLSPHISNFPL